MDMLSTPLRKAIGHGELPYIIAEVGANHNGDMGLCREIVDAAAEAGADAVKFQSWSRATLFSEGEYARHTSFPNKKQHFGTLSEMVERYALSEKDHHAMAEYCHGRNVDFCSSVFSNQEVDLLLSLDAPFLKVASMDVNNRPLLEYIASKGCQVILSTGLASLGEVDRAMSWLRDGGAGPICLLHCVAIYPPEVHTVHLRNMETLRMAFDAPVGFSDHTLGVAIPLAAVALGACVIEKHFTVDKNLVGWDHAISADPEELATIVRESRNVHASLGSHRRVVTPVDEEKKEFFRRCIVLARDMRKGERLGREDLDYKRPGTGIHPEEYPYVLGRVLARDMQRDDKLSWEDME